MTRAEVTRRLRMIATTCPMGQSKASRPMPQAEVAAELGCTRANVSMIEVRALRKLRRALESIGVDGPCAEPAGVTYPDAEVD